MAAPPSTLMSIPREIRDIIIENVVREDVVIDICPAKDEAYDRFFKINTLVIFLNEDDSTSVNEVNLKRVRRITIEPYWRELPTIVLTHHATGWQVKESYETVEMNEWLSIVKDSNLEPTVRAVQAILEEGAGKGLTADCVKKVRMAQQSILANMGEGQSGSWSY